MSRYGAYANPQPYADAKTERDMLAGRLRVAIGIRDRCVPGSKKHASWQETVDRLLEHHANADVRAATEALERVM